ncbi:nicotinate-nucleotide--dimethylbenzimidazole phosphoribosyltransferase [Rhizobium sp. S-51]|uniref:Nicotinate-nucleotide--dimethylbenzimidazole phosphoribosyltransferase n=1 Tax=Rhizobium terricola TaxID=2728849 RepID=A0A7Y0AZ71_9HYPH|nr:nicotinate-nucleotide--dimethylbenzimidazole phosphoribosyltransferase [Rhizobium terricola]NML76218.1 nicotinate-nucleotide--dimethylbenzimidazole phosphoribosyltransferase [Rhizobium terricola]
MTDMTDLPAAQAERPRFDSMTALRGSLRHLPEGDEDTGRAAAAREAMLTKPPGSLGRLEEIVAWLARWQGIYPPRMDRPQVCVFAGNHGIAQAGVSAYPPVVTEQMVRNFERGGAAINQLSVALGARLAVVPIELSRPVANFLDGPAMDEGEFVDAFNIGMAAVRPGSSLLCPGEMGIGNTTAAAAICHALLGGSPIEWCGRGSGIETEGVARKAEVIRLGVTRHRADIGDGLDALRILGGREIVAMAGSILAARLQRIPVMLDGFICTAAALALHASAPGALAHCMVGHVSMEPGHQRLLAHLEKRPLLSLDLRLGEGTGGVIAAILARTALQCHLGMATFEEAGVSTS